VPIDALPAETLLTSQETEVFEVPVTVALNFCGVPMRTLAGLGETETVGGGGVPPGEAPEVPPQANCVQRSASMGMSKARFERRTAISLKTHS